MSSGELVRQIGRMGEEGLALAIDAVLDEAVASGREVGIRRNRCTIGDLTVAARIDRAVHDALDDERTIDR